ncbi:hypothetical protein K3L72_01100 [Bacillus altitudinis]|uniref:hypothetical protein n=1 Tax=Bacillus TaxID=1386 RepID=UPI00064E501B|nr:MULTISPECIES: hypothetical protein [Bacillus]KML18966.1 hypothetical protein VL09_02320 [Bacillus stratosphericus]KML61676.1 hypothetical protein VL19_09850 [Bacillus stratosphericus]KMN30687.1 hypothetical protein ABW26_15020 [Bacillus stratosphericus]KMN75245.1 hypothetical protein VK97_04060 [Bacillus sp. LK10]MCA1015915.1 hypothetical protein [Bacillus stratosphericus]
MLWIFTQNQQSLVHINEVTVQGKKIEGIMGNDSWTKTLGKYDSSDRAAEILQDIVKVIEKNPNGAMTYRMPQQ